MKYIRNLVKMLFKSWLAAFALAMIGVGLFVSFDKHSADLSPNNLFVMTFAATSGLWLFVFAVMVVKNAMKGKPGFAGVKRGKLRWFWFSRQNYMFETMFSTDANDIVMNPINVFHGDD